jgi:hypothetical protein
MARVVRTTAKLQDEGTRRQTSEPAEKPSAYSATLAA